MEVNLKQINFLTFNGSYFLGYTYVPNYGIYIPQPTHKMAFQQDHLKI